MKLPLVGILSAFLLAGAGCGPTTSPCEQVLEKQKAVVDAYCGGKDDTCWYCKCRNQGEQVKATLDGDLVVFSCLPATAGPEAACEGTTLEQAQACLANEQSCITDSATLDATSKCGATKP
ncbi:MAG TPA: hypothetical protein VGK67_21645 [Myxococcales bacterium]|jgi:hypothetical protein